MTSEVERVYNSVNSEKNAPTALQNSDKGTAWQACAIMQSLEEILTLLQAVCPTAQSEINRVPL